MQFHRKMAVKNETPYNNIGKYIDLPIHNEEKVK